MKHIKKNAEPQGFIDWKKENWQKIEEKNKAGASGTKLWDIFPSNRSRPNAPNEYSKADLRTAIVSEQFYLCCYCMASIKGEPLDTKMEHFLPKETYKPTEVFSYQNLLAACNGGERTRPIELSCDSQKGYKDPIAVTILSPLQEDCEKHFDYKENGEIVGITTEGKATVNNLNFIFDVWKEDMNANIEIENVITPYFDEEKLMLQPFCMAIASILKHYP
jgi:uncharacterized protein (TIGR02646 family)